MLSVELVFYKIYDIKMSNNLKDNGLIQLENSMGFDLKFGQDDQSAVAVLTEYVRHREEPNLFCIELVVQGIFRLTGIKNVSAKREAHLKCYDELFPYANQIMTYLTGNSGMNGFMLKKFPIEFADINFGTKPDNMDSGKVIKLWSDK